MLHCFTDGTVDNCATEQVGPAAAGLPAAGRKGLWYTTRCTKGKLSWIEQLDVFIYSSKNIEHKPTMLTSRLIFFFTNLSIC